MKNILVCMLVFLTTSFAYAHQELDLTNVQHMQYTKKMLQQEIAKSTSVKKTIQLTNTLLSVYKLEKMHKLLRSSQNCIALKCKFKNIDQRYENLQKAKKLKREIVELLNE
jgi:hypothetical protein